MNIEFPDDADIAELQDKVNGFKFRRKSDGSLRAYREESNVGQMVRRRVRVHQPTFDGPSAA